MAAWLICVIVLGYLLIGAFVAAFMTDDNDTLGFGVFLFLWPIVLGTLIVLGLFSLPCMLADFIKDKFK